MVYGSLGGSPEANAAFIVEAVNNHARLEARVKELEGALRKYGRHSRICSSLSLSALCCCGLDAALSPQPEHPHA